MDCVYSLNTENHNVLSINGTDYSVVSFSRNEDTHTAKLFLSEQSAMQEDIEKARDYLLKLLRNPEYYANQESPNFVKLCVYIHELYLESRDPSFDEFEFLHEEEYGIYDTWLEKNGG